MFLTLLSPFTMPVIQATALLFVGVLFAVAATTLSSIVRRVAIRRKGACPFIAGVDSKEIKSQVPSKDEEAGYMISTGLGKAKIDIELQKYKELYYKLHNLEDFPEILPECGELLVSFLSDTIQQVQLHPENTILSIPRFDRADLEAFLATNHEDANNGWEGYLNRRKAGGAREMFSDAQEARWWLKQAAPVKYVDGAWLGHINKIATPFGLRKITKNAWQVMSEELGDGDLDKNHIKVYRDLMQEIDARLPEPNSEDFIHPRHDLNDLRVWKAAIAQLLISLFPHDFLPEVLGFNMAYETLPLHLMKTTKELKELGLNSYYFALHISIDNCNTGHAAMAMLAVIEYIDYILTKDGKAAAESAWRRVQAGFVLAEGLPTTPLSGVQARSSSPPFPRNLKERSIITIFQAKVKVAQKLHCNSRVRIGRHTLTDWLNPSAFESLEWQRNFIDDLSNCRPWVIKGDSGKSRLSRELNWEGKMFGSFTQNEVEAVNSWIDSLGPSSNNVNKQLYYDFTGRQSIVSFDMLQQTQAIDQYYPLFQRPTTNHFTPFPAGDFNQANPLLEMNIPDLSPIKFRRILPMWFASSSLLESFVNVPVAVSTALGSAIVKILRAQYGFDIEGPGVAGTDESTRTNEGKAIGLVEIGLDICQIQNLGMPKTLHEVLELDNGEDEFAKDLLRLSMSPKVNDAFLIGLTWAFMELHEVMAQMAQDWLSQETITTLRGIAKRERDSLLTCLHETKLDSQYQSKIKMGCEVGRSRITAILNGVHVR